MVDLATPSILDPNTGELALRIRSPRRRGQIVRLKSGKCTIGSGPRCTLRLRARRVQPIHCLILRGAEGTVIRRFASDTRLNGHPFGDAPLVPGDQLAVGPIEFEVLGTGRLGEEQPPPPVRPPDCEAEDRPGRKRAEELRRRLESATRQGHLRARRLIKALRSAKGQIARLEAKRIDPDQKENLNARSEKIQQARVELDRKCELLQQQQQQWEAERAEAERQLEERSEGLAAKSEELDARAAELQARESKLQTRAGQVEAASPPEDLLQKEQAEPEPSSSPPSEKLPTSSVEVLRQMGLVPTSDEEQKEESPESPVDPPATDSATPPDAASEPEEDDTESIDEYMARLLKRVHPTAGGSTEGSTGASAPEAEPASPEPASEPSSEPSVAPSVEPSAEPAPTGEPTEASAEPRESPGGGPESAELASHAKARERSIDLTAMRELANFSAHAALDSHARRKLSNSLTGKLVVALVAGAAACVLGWIWWTEPADTPSLYGGVVCLVVALFWGIHYAALRRYLATKSGRGREETEGGRPPG